MALRSLESTFIYNHLNRSNGLTHNIAALLTNGKVLSMNELEEPLMIINKNFKFPFKYKVLDAFKAGEIKVIYGENIKLPTCLPFVLTKDKSNRIVAAVVANIYGVYNDDTKSLKIDPKKLYCMMEAAYLSKMCFLHSNQLSTRAMVLSGGSNIYSSMFTRVLNKKYAINIDKSKMNKILFLSSKFYLINILGLNDSDVVFNYAIKNCPNGNLYSLKEVNDMLSHEDYMSIDKFIAALGRPELGLNLKDLTVRNYLESFINMYEASALLSLESFYYFLYNILSVIDGAYINNQYVLEDIVGNTGVKIYNDLLNMND